MTAQFPPKPDPSGLKPREVSLRNDIVGLSAIHRVKWLRPREIGNILWINAEKSRHVAGARICKKWLDHGYVIQRNLPKHYGYAYVLSQLGANFLIENGVPGATSGKRAGDFIGSADQKTGQRWLPTKLTFEHDLLAAGFLTLMLGRGNEIKTEQEIAQLNQQAGRKIPDGLVQTKSGEWMAVEVERARKYGDYMRSLCRNFVEIQGAGVSYAFRDETSDSVQDVHIPVTRIALAFEDLPEKDAMGRNIQNHADTIKPQLQAQMQGHESLQIAIVKLQCEGGSVLSFTNETAEIKPDWEAALSKYLLGNDWYWKPHNGKNIESTSAPYGQNFSQFVTTLGLENRFPFEVVVWRMQKDPGTGWRVAVSHRATDETMRKDKPAAYFLPFFEAHLVAFEEKSAQSEAIRLLQKTPTYRKWFQKKWTQECIDKL